MVLAGAVFPMVDVLCRIDTKVADDVVRAAGPAVIVANHMSHLDCPVILRVLPAQIRRRTVVAAAADYFYRYRICGAATGLIFGAIPMERHNANGTSLHACTAALRQGRSVLIFPEGTRSSGASAGTFHRGAAVLALRARVPIIPVGTAGLESILPKGARRPSPGNVAVRIAAPIQRRGGEDAAALTRRMEAAVHAASDDAAEILAAGAPIGVAAW